MIAEFVIKDLDDKLDKVNDSLQAILACLQNGAVPVQETKTDVTPVEINPEDYGQFQDVKEAARKLKALDAKVYKKILIKYVTDETKKYSAIEPHNWGKALADFNKAISELESKETETPVVSKKTRYFKKEDGDELLEVKKGTPLPDRVEYLEIAKDVYEKLVAKQQTQDGDEFEDEFEDEIETESPRLTRDALRKLCSIANNKGVKVGRILVEVTGAKKISLIEEKYFNAVEDAINAGLKELED